MSVQTTAEELAKQDAPANIQDDPQMKDLLAQFGKYYEDNQDTEQASVQPPVEEPEEEQAAEPDTEQPPVDDAEDSVEEGDTAEQEAGDGDEEALRLEIAALAEANGFEPSEFDSFDSVEDAEAAVRLYYSRLSQLGRQQQAADQQPETTQQQPQTPAPTQSNGSVDLSKLDLEKLSEDPELQEVFGQFKTALEGIASDRDALRQSIAALENQRLADQRQQSMNRFHQSVDTLGEDRYGKGSKLTHRQNLNRTKVAQEVNVLISGYMATGADPPDLDVLIRRADAHLFADEIRQKDKDGVRQEIRKSSRRRLGSPAGSKKPKQGFDYSKPLHEQGILLDALAEMDEGSD